MRLILDISDVLKKRQQFPLNMIRFHDFKLKVQRAIVAAGSATIFSRDMSAGYSILIPKDPDEKLERKEVRS